jgi:hypothetical protein
MRMLHSPSQDTDPSQEPNQEATPYPVCPSHMLPYTIHYAKSRLLPLAWLPHVNMMLPLTLAGSPGAPAQSIIPPHPCLAPPSTGPLPPKGHCSHILPQYRKLLHSPIHMPSAHFLHPQLPGPREASHHSAPSSTQNATAPGCSCTGPPHLCPWCPKPSSAM